MSRSYEFEMSDPPPFIMEIVQEYEEGVAVFIVAKLTAKSIAPTFDPRHGGDPGSGPEMDIVSIYVSGPKGPNIQLVGKELLDKFFAHPEWEAMQTSILETIEEGDDDSDRLYDERRDKETGL